MTIKHRAFGKAARDAFLAHLASTANVAASARVAGVPAHRVYRERRNSPAFHADWQEALAEGYARLESDLLAEALRPANGAIKDTTLKARQVKIRLGMSLLALHRSSVRGSKTAKPLPDAQSPDEIHRRLSARLSAMHDRLTSKGEADAAAAE